MRAGGMGSRKKLNSNGNVRESAWKRAWEGPRRGRTGAEHGPPSISVAACDGMHLQGSCRYMPALPLTTAEPLCCAGKAESGRGAGGPAAGQAQKAAHCQLPAPGRWRALAVGQPHQGAAAGVAARVAARGVAAGRVAVWGSYTVGGGGAAGGGGGAAASAAHALSRHHCAFPCCPARAGSAARSGCWQGSSSSSAAAAAAAPAGRAYGAGRCAAECRSAARGTAARCERG